MLRECELLWRLLTFYLLAACCLPTCFYAVFYVALGASKELLDCLFCCFSLELK